MYDFHKSRGKNDQYQVFQHAQFHRDKQEDLQLIKRKSNQNHPMRMHQAII